ncbi:tRNA dihydrouridine(20/20a) synthase DusA [Fretibacter rubidus]|uniref:tRNA dihydrouridine(20/20a) synthase DusA n=1 Tax=Fretibacter rubidus TaxID=570162 RepID=UPI00352B5B0F
MKQNQEFTVSVAPMMDWTDRHCRWFHRRLSRHARLYTEMVVADAVIHGSRDRLLGFDDSEHPVALQIGGSDSSKLARATEIGASYGYDEININIGCPSDRVQSGAFGACLMNDAPLVADCYRAMADASDVPVTVKCRLGVDDQDVATTLPHFIETVAAAGCKHFIIHARKAWLQGLSPKENRDVPPLDYDLVRDMKARFPKLEIVLNGGLTEIDDALNQTQGLDGFMLGRAAYHNPWILTQIDSAVYSAPAFARSRDDIVHDVIAYTQSREDTDPSTKAIIRHIMGIYAGQPGARLFRRRLSEGLSQKLLPSQVIENALHTMQSRKADAA